MRCRGAEYWLLVMTKNINAFRVVALFSVTTTGNYFTSNSFSPRQRCGRKRIEASHPRCDDLLCDREQGVSVADLAPKVVARLSRGERLELDSDCKRRLRDEYELAKAVHILAP